MSDIVSYVNRFSIEEQQHALACIYDQHLLRVSTQKDLAWAAQLDREIQRYLHHLAECDFDRTLSMLKWSE